MRVVRDVLLDFELQLVCCSPHSHRSIGLPSDSVLESIRSGSFDGHVLHYNLGLVCYRLLDASPVNGLFGLSELEDLGVVGIKRQSWVEGGLGKRGVGVVIISTIVIVLCIIIEGVSEGIRGIQFSVYVGVEEGVEGGRGCHSGVMEMEGVGWKEELEKELEECNLF
jgi:hypothetical protein